MIRFSCGYCQKKLSVKDEAAGKMVRCPACQRPVAIPPLGAATPSDLAVARTVTAGPPEEANDPARPPEIKGRAGSENRLPPAPSAPAHQGAETRASSDQRLGPGSGLEGMPRKEFPPAVLSPEVWDFLRPAELADEIGRLGPYRVLKVLGTGGMGVVFQAEDPQLKRIVALKAMLPVLAASESARKRFLREAQTAAAIEHDHIVPIFQVGEDRGVPFIAMPLLKGESLEARLKRDQALPVAEALRIGREAGKGLAAAHAAGLVHRDIKPANLWLEAEEGRVKILDFGLARAAADSAPLTHPGAVMGTPAYMAPEQAAGEPVDGRCDLFSLGCVLYYMCTGRPPFTGANPVATSSPRPPAEVRPKVPGDLSDLVMRLLAKKPDDRPASAEGVVKVIREIEGRAAGGADQPVRPVKEGADRSARPPSPKKPRGSRIKEDSTKDGRTFKWPLPGSGVGDYLSHVSMLCFFIYSAYQVRSLYWQSHRPVNWTSLLTVFGVPFILLISAIRYLRPSRPESITLGPDYFRHNLGRPGGYLVHSDTFRQHGVDNRPLWRWLLGLPLIVEISKDELGEIVIERDTDRSRTGQLRLRYDAGADRLEIGRYLREPEKEWLAEILRAWQDPACQATAEKSGRQG
jgi:serine/threonine protein kinase